MLVKVKSFQFVILALLAGCFVSFSAASANQNEPTFTMDQADILKHQEQPQVVDPLSGEATGEYEQEIQVTQTQDTRQEADNNIPVDELAKFNPLFRERAKCWRKLSKKVRIKNIRYFKNYALFAESLEKKKCQGADCFNAPTKPPGPGGVLGAIYWGDLHAIAFDGSYWDHNEVSKPGWWAFVHDKNEYSNISLVPWHHNKNTSVITGFTLVTKYGPLHRFYYDVNDKITLDGHPIKPKHEVVSVDQTRKVFYLYEHDILRIITPSQEYSVIFLKKDGYGNIGNTVRQIPHADGTFATGLAGDSQHFMGYAAGDFGKVTTKTTTSVWNPSTEKGSHRLVAGQKQIGYYIGKNPYGLPSITAFGKRKVLRIDGFYPCECAF